MFLQFVASLLIFGQDITLPETIKGEPSVFIPITAVTKGEIVQFVPLDSGLSVFPSNLLTDRKTTVVVASKAGKYRVLAYTAIDNKPSSPAITTLIVGNPGPDPLPPNPVPPTPPGPMPPNPVPPTPPDQQFNEAVQSMFGGLQEQDKSASVKKLINIYSFALKEVDNPNYKTQGDLFAAVKTFSNRNLQSGKIDSIREMCADKSDAEIGTDSNTSLTPEVRTKIKANFNKILTALGGINV